MAAPKYQWILARLSELRDAQNSSVDDSILRDDLDDIVEDILVSAARQVDLRRLSRLFEDRAALDFAALRAAVEIFRRMNMVGPIRLTAALTVDPAEHITGLENDIRRLENLLTEDPANSGGLALDMIIGGQLMRLAMCAIAEGKSLVELFQLTKSKIALLEPPQVALLWSYVQREFDKDRDVKMEQINNILPPEFLQFQGDAQARDKLAHYIVEWKQRLMLALHGRQGSGFPVDVPSLANVLSWKSSDVAVGISVAEIRLAKSIQRIAGIVATMFERKSEEIASALSVDPSSPLVQLARKRIDRSAASIAALSYELRKAAQFLSELSLKDLDFAECLRRYKLGIEVMAPEINKSFRGKGEILLQKELSRYSLEHGYFVVGTRFGRSETDLVSWEKEALYIVETKLFRTSYQANTRGVTNALAQLSSYMDQHPTTPFGVLVIYNLSTVQISAPARWIQQRFLILPINLQPGPPSHRTHVLEIVETNTDSLIAVRKIGQAPKRKSARRRKKAGKTRNP